MEILCAFARIVIATWRIRWSAFNKAAGDANDAALPAPVIFCVWHNRLAMALASNNVPFRELWPATGLAAVVSASRDGAFLASILEHFGMQPIRGSSSRRGAQALLEATGWLSDKGYNIAITPDGPRGPCYKIQEGIISLAQLTGRPIVPLGFEGRPHFKARSWDKFQVPLPFASCNISFAEPIFVPRTADDAERERIRAEVERVMLKINTP
ncbi:MAG: lysophospholipid acyltransferase family protein [Limisphaerales bacterium]